MPENNIITSTLTPEQALRKEEFTAFQAASQAKTSAVVFYTDYKNLDDAKN